MSDEVMRFLEGIREHIASQMERISSENELRIRLLQEEMDRRFADSRITSDERRDNAVYADRLLQEQMDRRLADAERLDIQRHGDLKELMATGQAAAKEAVQAALTSAKEAVTKAEIASEKRFEGVNEFRKALTDQTTTFIPRVEHDSQYKGMADRVTANADRMGALELRLTSRLDTASGEKSGGDDQRTENRGSKAQAVSTTVMILVAIATFVSVAALIVSLVVNAHP